MKFEYIVVLFEKDWPGGQAVFSIPNATPLWAGGGGFRLTRLIDTDTQMRLVMTNRTVHILIGDIAFEDFFCAKKEQKLFGIFIRILISAPKTLIQNKLS